MVTLTFDLLTLKMVCESHLRWVTFLPNLGTLGFWVLELFAMYATDRRMDGQKQRLLPLLYGREHNKPALKQPGIVKLCKYCCDQLGL